MSNGLFVPRRGERKPPPHPASPRKSTARPTPIRNFQILQAEERFIQGSETRVNNLNRAHFSLWCSNYWLTNRVRMIGAVVCALVGGFLVGSVSICFLLCGSLIGSVGGS